VNGLLTVAQVSAMLNVHPNTVRRYIRTHQLKATKLTEGSPWRIRREDLDEFMRKEEQ
jgi:excisionase family DNA binding protein